MQAGRPTSEADQSCPVRKRAASEVTQPEALLYCSGHNHIDCEPAPTRARGGGETVATGVRRTRKGKRLAGWTQDRKGRGHREGPTLHSTACVDLRARGPRRKSLRWEGSRTLLRLRGLQVRIEAAWGRVAAQQAALIASKVRASRGPVWEIAAASSAWALS